MGFMKRSSVHDFSVPFQCLLQAHFHSLSTFLMLQDTSYHIAQYVELQSAVEDGL